MTIPQEPYTLQAWSYDLDRLMLDHGDYRRRLGDAADRAARLSSLSDHASFAVDGPAGFNPYRGAGE